VTEKGKPGPKEVPAIKAVVKGFLEALMRGPQDKPRKSWREFAQLTFRDSKAEPAIPVFQGYKIQRVRKVPGWNDKTVREVDVELLLSPTGGYPLRWLSGTLRVIKESEPYKPDENGEWGVCPVSWRPRRS